MLVSTSAGSSWTLNRRLVLFFLYNSNILSLFTPLFVTFTRRKVRQYLPSLCCQSNQNNLNNVL